MATKSVPIRTCARQSVTALVTVLKIKCFEIVKSQMDSYCRFYFIKEVHKSNEGTFVTSFGFTPTGAAQHISDQVNCTSEVSSESPHRDTQ